MSEGRKGYLHTNLLSLSMRYSYLLIIAFAYLFVACNKDDDTPSNSNLFLSTGVFLSGDTTRINAEGPSAIFDCDQAGNFFLMARSENNQRLTAKIIDVTGCFPAKGTYSRINFLYESNLNDNTQPVYTNRIFEDCFVIIDTMSTQYCEGSFSGVLTYQPPQGGALDTLVVTGTFKGNTFE